MGSASRRSVAVNRIDIGGPDGIVEVGRSHGEALGQLGAHPTPVAAPVEAPGTPVAETVDQLRQCTLHRYGRHTRGEPADLPEGAGAGTPRTRVAAPRCGNRERVSCTDPPGRTLRSRSRRARSPRDLVPPVRTSPRPRRFSGPCVEPGRPPRRTPSHGTAPRDGNRCGEASADPRSVRAVRSAPAPREPPRDPTVAGAPRALPDRQFAIPAWIEWAEALPAITLSGPAGSARLLADDQSAHTAALVLNPATEGSGQSFAIIPNGRSQPTAYPFCDPGL